MLDNEIQGLQINYMEILFSSDLTNYNDIAGTSSTAEDPEISTVIVVDATSRRYRT